MINKQAGWKPEEEELLFFEVDHCRKNGRPLRDVFEKVAEKTGRKPNSIRNYYYMKAKEGVSRQRFELASPIAFVPFSPDESQTLLKTVLKAQTNGTSVRACTLQMANDDNKLMLRYQNKYRALLKNNPQLVRQIASEVARETGKACNPYAAGLRHAHKPPAAQPGTQSLSALFAALMRELSAVEDLNTAAFVEGLSVLAQNAKRGAAKAKADSDDVDTALKTLLAQKERELVFERDRFNALLALFGRLLALNRGFLDKSGVPQISGLKAYIKDLSKNVAECERMLPV